MKSCSILISSLVVSVFYGFVEASHKGKLTGKQRANIKLFKKLKKQSQKIANQIAKLKEDIAAAEKLSEASSRHLFGSTGTAGDALTVVDAHFVGNQCGTFTLTSYLTVLNVAF